MFELLSDPGPEDLETRVKNPQVLTKQLGAYLEAKTTQTFRTQGRGSVKWEPRRVPNLPGTVKDLEGGGNPKTSRFIEKPALIDTGRLRGSIRSKPAGKFVVEVGTTVPYANKHHTGATSRMPVPERLRGNIKKLFVSHPEHSKQWQRLLGRTGKTLVTQLPKRPIVFVIDEDRRNMGEIISEQLDLSEGQP